MADYSKQINTEITFTDESTGSPTSFEWDFGDGTPIVTTTQKTVAHTYTTTDTFIVTHTTTNTCGTNICVRTIEVIPPIEEPIPAEMGASIFLMGGLIIGLIYAATRKKNK